MISPENAMKQAAMTAHEYMRYAIHNIDSLLGKGYAAKHPELIVAFMQTCVTDYNSTMTK